MTGIRFPQPHIARREGHGRKCRVAQAPLVAGRSIDTGQRRGAPLLLAHQSSDPPSGRSPGDTAATGRDNANRAKSGPCSERTCDGTAADAGTKRRARSAGIDGRDGRATGTAIVRPEMVVRHMVVTVDNLSRKRAAVQLWPVKPVPGQFMIHGDDQHATLDPANYQRYTTYVQVLQMVDTKQLADLYFHFYPLFQQAYQNLGYPNGYFNDRLVETIDNLLQTPDVKGDVALVRPNVMYQYADPNLESLSAGQKVLLRMGPDNEAAVKAKLRELKAAIADRSSRRRRRCPGPRRQLDPVNALKPRLLSRFAGEY